ncbi:MAG: DUF2812 domain-containing protein [Anaerolineaceae bacterium]|nr:DUF2812 domain-containing protein [Anaerolineaceae bacterium]
MNTKRINKLFNPWQYEEEQAWLQEMAHQGWQLKKLGILGASYIFEKAAPRETIYRMDYVGVYGRKLKQYRALFTDSGWEYVCANPSGFQYFRVPAAEFSTDIYSDLPSRLEQMKRMNEAATALFVSLLLIYGVTFLNLEIFSLPVGLLLTLVFISPYIHWMTNTGKKIKVLKQRLADGESE